jgi:hypothetical protein
MKTFEKIYLGKGKKVTNLRIVKLTLKLEDVMSIAYEFEGTHYLTFEVAEMLKPDQFGRTHTVYYRKAIEDQPAPEPVTLKPAKKPAIDKAVAV